MLARKALDEILAHPVSWRGRRQPIAQWIDEIGADRGTVLIRITGGWSLEKALLEPVRPPKRWTKRTKQSRFRGVTRHPSGKWYARGYDGESNVDLLLTDDEAEAGAAYNVWVRNRYGLRAKVNLL